MKTTTAEKCRDCEATEGVENGLCDSCADHYVYCQICQEDQHEDSVCRHLFWDDALAMWSGSGCAEVMESERHHYRPHIEALLDECGYAFAVWLFDALRLDQLRLRFCGPMLGPMSVENNPAYRPKRDWRKFYTASLFSEYHAPAGLDLSHVEDDKIPGSAFESAVYWLSSLWPDAKDARERTMGWVWAWLKKQDRR
jgi:hypothetical protein